ncbi:hypothetical protein [Colwellia piezophila]|uniref:hypothetical protein n=1 Tax=Colwellia piezophila TaxID=211668 RepID=UPI000362F9B7|nr:hypothetical protein [Colwellia piezophila]
MRIKNKHSLTIKRQNDGYVITIDEESYLLPNFSEQCYQLSDGLFEIIGSPMLASALKHKLSDIDNVS